MFPHAIAKLKAVPAWAWAFAILVAPLLAAALWKWWSWSFIENKTVGIGDPDVWLRLTLAREWLLGGSWYDHSIPRGDAPFGNATSPWTRPLDVVIALLVKLQFYAASIDLKLIRASLLLPVIWMALLMGGLLRIHRQWRTPIVGYFLMAALVGASPVMWNYFAVGNADHHAMLAALWVWVLSFFVTESNDARDATWFGTILALMLWISPEALALIGAIYAYFGLRWLSGDNGFFLARATTATALTSFAALLIERGSWDLTHPLYDSLSIAHVFVLSLSALLAWAMCATRSKKLPVLLIGGGGLIATIWYYYPLFFKGPMAEVDPFILTDFLPNITEAEPLLHTHPLMIIAMLIQPLAALTICIYQLRHEGVFARETALRLAFLIAVTLALYFMQQRWYYYLYPLVAIALAPWLAALFSPDEASVKGRWPARWLSGLPETQQAARRIPLLIVLVMLPLILVLVKPSEDTKASKEITACLKDARKIIQQGGLNDLPPTTFLLPSDIATELLFFTHHRIIASNYHREGAALKYVWDTDRIKTTGELRKHLTERQVGALLICPRAGQPEDGILRQLRKGSASTPWLKKWNPQKVRLSKRAPAIFLVKP